MPAWVEQISANNFGIYGVAVIGVLIAIILIMLIFRLMFGRRLRMPNSRQRLARLGIVDAFSLDRQRQLVIVRRDNVEHLILIGGPNDILIESEIIRAEARESRDPRSREKESKELGIAPALNGAIRTPASAVPGLANFPAQAAESLSSLSAAPDGGQAAPIQQAVLQVGVTPTVPPLTVPPVSAPSASARPSQPIAMPRAADLSARVRQAPTAPAAVEGQLEVSAQQPGTAAPAVEKKPTPPENSPLPRPVSTFTTQPRPNPFPIPPRRAPVTTPLPKTLLPREAETGPQTDQSAEKSGAQRLETGAKIEPSLPPRPSFLRPPSGSSSIQPLSRPFQRSVPLQDQSTAERAPEPKELESKGEATEPIDVNAQVAQPPIATASAPDLPKTQPPAVSAQEPAAEGKHLDKTEELSPAAANVLNQDPKDSGETKIIAEEETADSLISLEAEMAKLLGRE